MKCLVLIMAVFAAVSVTLVQGQARNEIWYNYQKLLNPEMMTKLVNCVTDQSNCSSQELRQAKEVVQEYYTNECRNCCSFRRNMMREIIERAGPERVDMMKTHFELS